MFRKMNFTDEEKIRLEAIGYLKEYEKYNNYVDGTRELIFYTIWLVKKFKK